MVIGSQCVDVHSSRVGPESCAICTNLVANGAQPEAMFFVFAHVERSAFQRFVLMMKVA
jgi:hypothetical protein